jgi:hypothetical protein
MRAFWRKVTQEAQPGKLEEIAGDGKRSAGPVLCFAHEPRCERSTSLAYPTGKVDGCGTGP